MFIDLINLQLNAVFSSLNICMQPTNRSTLFKKIHITFCLEFEYQIIHIIAEYIFSVCVDVEYQ